MRRLTLSFALLSLILLICSPGEGALAPFLGPECYAMQRTREGGSRQWGVLCGVRGGYERIKGNALYWGIDGLWAQGTLKGHMQHRPLYSRFTDSNVELRGGYTWHCPRWSHFAITPYLGLGLFWEKTLYHAPSPLPLHFHNQFSYAAAGFLSHLFLSSQWSVGFNCKLRYPIEGRQTVSHDPAHETLVQSYEERLQYRLELPFTYFFCIHHSSAAIALVPFFESRCYGSRPNFPFDFLETTLRLYGATVKAIYLF